MSEYILLAAALTFAFPYGYLIVAMILRQPRQGSTWVAVVVLLFLWPSCAFMSFMQLGPVIAMSMWWWSCDFSMAEAGSQPLRFRRTVPPGLVAMLLATVLAAIASGLYSYWVWREESTRNLASCGGVLLLACPAVPYHLDE